VVVEVRAALGALHVARGAFSDVFFATFTQHMAASVEANDCVFLSADWTLNRRRVLYLFQSTETELSLALPVCYVGVEALTFVFVLDDCLHEVRYVFVRSTGLIGLLRRAM
jgi:hypothetical protein